MRKLVAVSIAVLLATTACGSLFEPAAAVVGGQKITAEEIRAGLDDFKATEEYKRLTTQSNPRSIQRQFEQAFLSQLIRRGVLKPKAEELDIEVGEEEIQERLDEIKDDFPTDSAFEEALKEQGLTVETLEGLVADSVLEEKLRNEITAEFTPTAEEVRAYYDDNIEQFTRTHSQHILVQDAGVAATIAERLHQAPKKQVEKLFAQLAKEFSTDKSNANNAGDLSFTAPGELVAPFERAMAELDEGEVSDPVKTEFGFHIIRVIERRTTPVQAAAADIEEQIGGQEQEEAWSEFVREAYEAADIKVNSRYGELDLETQQVVDATPEDIPGAEVATPSPTPTAP